MGTASSSYIRRRILPRGRPWFPRPGDFARLTLAAGDAACMNPDSQTVAATLLRARAAFRATVVVGGHGAEGFPSPGKQHHDGIPLIVGPHRVAARPRRPDAVVALLSRRKPPAVETRRVSASRSRSCPTPGNRPAPARGRAPTGRAPSPDSGDRPPAPARTRPARAAPGLQRRPGGREVCDQGLGEIRVGIGGRKCIQQTPEFIEIGGVGMGNGLIDFGDRFRRLQKAQRHRQP